MDDFVIYTTTGRRKEIGGADSMRRMLYYPTVDRMLSEMKSRFSPQNEAVMMGINACNPSSDTFLELKPLRKLATHYSMELFEAEVAVGKNLIRALQMKETKKFTMEKVYGLLDSTTFPTLKKIFQVSLTVPVTSCSCERSFSCLRRVKTWLRSKMTHDRLDHLSVLAIETSTYTSCTDKELVSAFNSKKPRRQ